jgi:hypothetical protein
LEGQNEQTYIFVLIVCNIYVPVNIFSFGGILLLSSIDDEHLENVDKIQPARPRVLLGQSYDKKAVDNINKERNSKLLARTHNFNGFILQ